PGRFFKTGGFSTATDHYTQNPRGFQKSLCQALTERIDFAVSKTRVLRFPKTLGFGRLTVHNTFEHSEKTSSRKALQHLKFHHVSVSGCMKLPFPSNSTRITSSIKVSCS